MPLERITDYIDKQVLISLGANRNDAAKARFLCNATRETTWAQKVTTPVAASATYWRTTQALVTSRRDKAELEEALDMNQQNLRGKNHRRLLYQTGGKRNTVPDSDDDGEPDMYFEV